MFFFNDLLTSVIYTLSLHDALPIYDSEGLIRKETVNTRIYTSWKDPRLYFENVPDRKSTRLNSSHVATSYAVLCLKKKKHMMYSPESFKKYTSPESVSTVCTKSSM